MRRAFEESVEDEVPEETPDVEASPVEEPVTSSGSGRDERGRFAKKVSEPEEIPEEIAGLESAERVTEDQPPTEAAPITAPLSWPGDMRKLWSKLPREAQDYIAKRDLETQQAFSRKGRQDAELEEVFKPYADEWAVRGITPVQVVKQYMAWAEQLQRDPIGASLRLAQQYGATPDHFRSALSQGQQGLNQAYQPPPTTHLEHRLAQLEQMYQSQSEQAQEQQRQGTAAEIEGFFGETDKGGNLLRPYYVEVYPTLTSITRAMREANPTMPIRDVLSRAYDAAIAADPDIRGKVESDREASRIERERQHVEKARRMGSSVTGSPNGQLSKPVPADTRDLMWAAYNGDL